MFQLTIDALDTFFPKPASLSLELFQPGYILVFSAMWIIVKQIVRICTPNSGRLVGLIHAFVMFLTGFPLLLIITNKSFGYADMHECFHSNSKELISIGNLLCYASVGYYLMDSYFLVQRAYLKHHVGAVIAWLTTAYHHETSLIHSCVVIAMFELGAILVQCSRMFPKVLWFRFFVCCGYSATRIVLFWYHGFILYEALCTWDIVSIVVKLIYIPLFSSLLFLLILNAKWTFLQWRAFLRVFTSEAGMDFYSYHQKIIGNTD